MSYKLVFSKTAQQDLARHRKSGDKLVLKKLEKLLHELLEHPYTGTGKPEKLKHELQGLFSRRINKKHRLVYSVDDETKTISVLSAAQHYGSK